MPAQAHRSARLGLTLLIGAALAACSSFDSATNRLVGVVTPYKIDVVQGNFVSREQVEALQPGMGRQQVRDLLGTPLVTSLFHDNRWDYVFTLKRPGAPLQTRKLAVFFEGDSFARAEGDDMPTESEFVATLGTGKAPRKAPPLQATDAQLARFPGRTMAPAAPALPAAPVSYPPLEPASAL